MSEAWKTVPSHHRRCARCSKNFASRQAVAQHLRDKHKVEPGASDFAETYHKKSQGEASIADELVEAQIAHAAGEPVPKYLLDMFPEAFEARGS